MSITQQIATIISARRAGAKFYMTEEGRERFLEMVKDQYDPTAEPWVAEVIEA